jgi:hypothetical protein
MLSLSFAGGILHNLVLWLRLLRNQLKYEDFSRVASGLWVVCFIKKSQASSPDQDFSKIESGNAGSRRQKAQQTIVNLTTTKLSLFTE